MEHVAVDLDALYKWKETAQLTTQDKTSQLQTDVDRLMQQISALDSSGNFEIIICDYLLLKITSSPIFYWIFAHFVWLIMNFLLWNQLYLILSTKLQHIFC